MSPINTEQLLQPTDNENATRKATISATVATQQDGQRREHTSLHSYEARSHKVAWEFDGKALRDRNVVLMATSFVPWADLEKAE